MTNLTIKTSLEDFEAKITQLESYLNQLDQTLTDYETLKNNIDKFIDSTDDNYDSIRAHVESNIKMVRKAKELALASLKLLKETLDSHSEFSEKSKKIINENTSEAEIVYKNALEALSLLD